MTPRLIVFDVDGTLIDSQAVIIQSMGEAYASVGQAVPEEKDILSIVGLSLPEAMRVLSPSANEFTVEALVEAYRGSFLARRTRGGGEASVPLYAGARDCLLRLNGVERNVLGTATGKARRGLDAMIDAHALHGIFVTLQTADFHPSKPHPAMLETACTETGIAPDRAVMIGDTSFDMEMGKAAGFATIGVSWGYHPLERLNAAADLIVDTFDALEGAIEQLVG